ncbi:ribonuclease HII [Tuberibacillus sp. Marseille-P3662]|uniref:ribonuclease HII n=1 Tax=Tuberibacillus sp. Marseille-P3662 TaxID=1965358 RepID=UPI000A1CD16D|nr:ribonuclease HII [Tuberibacillus sp. Marseille-P3662]
MEKMTIKEIKTFLDRRATLTESEWAMLRADHRKGVQELVGRMERAHEKQQEALKRWHDLNQYEHALRDRGIRRIAGIDEVGRGPLAGPVVACAVILPADDQLLGVNDSKTLSRDQRQSMVGQIKDTAEAIGIGVATPEDIDRVNIYQASKMAMVRAVEQLSPAPDHLLVDAMDIPLSIAQTSIIKGDAKSISIAAASIIAKETRDEMMINLGKQYPDYGFEDHMGYPTKQHMEALDQLGPIPDHRRSFRPVRERLKG